MEELLDLFLAEADSVDASCIVLLAAVTLAVFVLCRQVEFVGFASIGAIIHMVGLLIFLIKAVFLSPFLI